MSTDTTVPHIPLGLGEIVSWQPPKVVRFLDLKAALGVAGLDEALAREMLPRNAFSRAAKSLAEHRIIRQVSEDEKQIIFQFTQEHLSDGKYEYSYETKLYLGKENGSVVCPDHPELAPLAMQLIQNEMEVRKTMDVSRLIQRIFDQHSADLVPIRSQGGVYFVVESQQELIESVDVLLKTIGGHLRRFRITPDSATTAQSVARSMHEYMLTLLSDFEKTCGDINRDSAPHVLQRRALRVIELRGKLDANKDLLQDLVSDVSERLDQAEKLLAEKLTEETEADGEAVVEPPVTADQWEPERQAHESVTQDMDFDGKDDYVAIGGS